MENFFQEHLKGVFIMHEIEQTLDSREVAEMVGKEHKELLRDIRRYCKQLGESNIALTDFFTESTYVTEQNKIMPCYRVTKKGCEFIAHKLTGTKGTVFTARYINRFHEMQDIITSQQSKPELPWFIKKFKGKYIVLERDFIKITGVNRKDIAQLCKEGELIQGLDLNGHGWECNQEEFMQKYGFEYGDDQCMFYFYLGGAVNALRLLSKRVHINPESYKMMEDGINMYYKLGKIEKLNEQSISSTAAGIIEKKLPDQINIRITFEKMI